MQLFNNLVDAQPIVEESIITVLLEEHCITCGVSIIKQEQCRTEMEVWLQNDFFDSINFMSMDTTKWTGSDSSLS